MNCKLRLEVATICRGLRRDLKNWRFPKSGNYRYLYTYGLGEGLEDVDFPVSTLNWM